MALCEDTCFASHVRLTCADVDGKLRQYRMQQNGLLEHAPIDYPGMPWRIMADPHRECLLICDGEKGKVRMLGKRGGQGKWVAGTLLDDPQMEIRSMCVLDANTLSIFDRKSSALRIYEFA